MKVKAASRCPRRHWVREWNRMSSVSSGFRRTTRLESCPTRGTDAADRPCYSDGVQQSRLPSLPGLVPDRSIDLLVERRTAGGELTGVVVLGANQRCAVAEGPAKGVPGQ